MMATEAPMQATRGFLGRLSGIFFQPRAEWRAIAAEPMTQAGILLKWVLPLTLIAPIAYMVRSLTMGDHFLDQMVIRPVDYLLVVMLIKWAVMIASTTLLAGAIGVLAPMFGGKRDAVAPLKLAAFGMTPWYISDALGAVPAQDLLPFVAAVPVMLLVIVCGLYSFYLFFTGLNPVLAIPVDRSVAVVAILVVVSIGIVVLSYIIGDAIAGAMLQPLPVGTRVFSAP